MTYVRYMQEKNQFIDIAYNFLYFGIRHLGNEIHREKNMFCKFNSISLILSFRVHVLLKLSSKSLNYITVIINVIN